jgi:acylglycerol lipase
MHDRDGRLAGGAIYYRVWDALPAEANVIISHGYAEHSGRYDHVAEALVDAGYVVWAIDHRGHGHSTGDRGDIVSWESAVADLDCLVDLATEQLAGRPTLLVGHSLGGAIAVAYALAHGSRLAGLSLSAPALQLPPELLALANLTEIPPLPLAEGVSSDPKVVDAYLSDPLVYQGSPPLNLLRMMASVGELIDRLCELSMPVHIMHGSADALVPVGAFREVVTRVSSVDVVARLWPGLFHEIFNEPTNGAVVSHLVEWVSERVG